MHLDEFRALQGTQGVKCEGSSSKLRSKPTVMIDMHKKGGVSKLTNSIYSQPHQRILHENFPIYAKLRTRSV